jgi:hypothetical protein
MTTRDRSASRSGRGVTPNVNINNRIFDPDEMLRQSNDSYHRQHGSATLVTGTSITPQHQPAANTYTPSHQTNNGPPQSNTNTPPVDTKRATQAAQREKQREVRQRIREQYGLS